MVFTDRQFDLYVVLGNPSCELPWIESQWQKIAEALDPLVQAARDRAAVRSLQLRPGSGSPNRRAIAFGRIGWNPEGHKKWVHRQTSVPDTSDAPSFVSAEVWAPSWTICEKEGRAPDLYFGIKNEQSKPGEALPFNSICLFAVAHDQGARILELGRMASERVGQLLAGVVKA